MIELVQRCWHKNWCGFVQRRWWCFSFYLVKKLFRFPSFFRRAGKRGREKVPPHHFLPIAENATNVFSCLLYYHRLSGIGALFKWIFPSPQNSPPNHHHHGEMDREGRGRKKRPLDTVKLFFPISRWIVSLFLSLTCLLLFLTGLNGESLKELVLPGAGTHHHRVVAALHHPVHGALKRKEKTLEISYCLTQCFKSHGSTCISRQGELEVVAFLALGHTLGIKMNLWKVASERSPALWNSFWNLS